MVSLEMFSSNFPDYKVLIMWSHDTNEQNCEQSSLKGLHYHALINFSQEYLERQKKKALIKNSRQLAYTKYSSVQGILKKCSGESYGVIFNSADELPQDYVEEPHKAENEIYQRLDNIENKIDFILELLKKEQNL